MSGEVGSAPGGLAEFGTVPATLGVKNAHRDGLLDDLDGSGIIFKSRRGCSSGARTSQGDEQC